MYRDKEYLIEEYINKNRTEQDISNEWGIDPKLLHYYIKKAGLTGIKSRRKYSVNELKFSINNPIYYYFAGLVVTDGYVDYKNHRVSIRVKNEGSKEVLQNIAKDFEFTGEVKLYRGCNDLTITSDVLIKKLRTFCIRRGEETKTYSLTFPKLLTTEDCKRMFCRGVLDGDGNIHTYISPYTNKVLGGQFRIVTASDGFIEGLIEFLNKHLGLSCKKSIAKVRGVEYPKLEMTVKDSMIFYDWVYKGFNEFRFLDKYKKYQLLKGEDIV